MTINSEKLWYSNNIFSILLLPLAWLFRLVTFLRRVYYQATRKESKFGNSYVIVVGNITVGGTGKTPFVAYLAHRCIENNLKVGIVSRGYGRASNQLVEVMSDSPIDVVGDEALMLKQQLACPVVVASNRVRAAKFIVSKYDLNVVISDDGLQHYKLSRDYEIAIVDGRREFGNGRLLPAGPLREMPSRLQQCDLVVSSGKNPAYEYQYTVLCEHVVSLISFTERKSIEEFKYTKVHAVAGIGNPKRFFAMLEKSGLSIIPHAFPDHHDFIKSDLDFDDNLPILMTEKDAVKCRHSTKENTWYLPLTLIPNAKLEERITKLLKEIA